MSYLGGKLHVNSAPCPLWLVRRDLPVYRSVKSVMADALLWSAASKLYSCTCSFQIGVFVHLTHEVRLLFILVSILSEHIHASSYPVSTSLEVICWQATKLMLAWTMW